MAGETVLVVDDRKDTIRFLGEYVLEPNGYKMLSANDGADALAIVLGQKVDLIISDLVMPRMGGLELLETLREKGLDTPAILMTFHGSEGTAVRAFRLGARDYIIKPFTIEEMLDAVDRALTESRLRQERDHLTQTVLRANQQFEKMNRQLESRVQEMRFLYGIGRSVTSLRDLEQILNRIVEAAVYLTGAEEGSLMLLDQESGDLYLRAVRGMGEKSAKSSRVKVQDSIAGQVIRTGRPVMIGGVDQDDSFKVMTGYFVKSLLNVPLKVKERVIGVLAVNNKTVVKAFSERHLNLLMALADYASIAIENARLYAQLSSDVTQAEKSSRELEKLVEARTDELKQANWQLLSAEKLAALGYMATGVAKALNKPIDTILKGVYQLSKRVEMTPENYQIISHLEKESLHCRRVVRNLLEFSGHRKYEPQATNLNDVIEAAWSKYINENEGGDKVEFVRGFDPYLPTVSLDGQQMEQALFYLIQNAYESMPAGGKLRVTTRSVGAEVQLIVSDTGPGISAKDMRHIFDPFYETKNHAYGLGLSITHGVIQRHGGRIEVDSEPGQGTTFTIHLTKG